VGILFVSIFFLSQLLRFVSGADIIIFIFNIILVFLVVLHVCFAMRVFLEFTAAIPVALHSFDESGKFFEAGVVFVVEGPFDFLVDSVRVSFLAVVEEPLAGFGLAYQLALLLAFFHDVLAVHVRRVGLHFVGLVGFVAQLVQLGGHR